MGFFSELKSDLSQAVNTLMPEDKPSDTDSLDKEVTGEEKTKVPEKVDLGDMLNRLDDIKLDEVRPEESKDSEETTETANEEKEEPKETEHVKKAEPLEELEEKIEEQTKEEVLKEEEPKSALEAIASSHVEEYVAENKEIEKKSNNGGNEVMDFEQQTPTDEVASITEGMVINGDLQTTGSLDLVGKITGNIKCLGKLNVTGEITGDSDAAEIYAEAARITGEVKSRGSVKVGQSTVIVGNIFGSSAVIAGAVKGDIDVHGPVVLDTTAIVMGNIKSQSVQINNGAVIEGMCSQAYADVNPSEFFEGLKNK